MEALVCAASVLSHLKANPTSRGASLTWRTLFSQIKPLHFISWLALPATPLHQQLVHRREKLALMLDVAKQSGSGRALLPTAHQGEERVTRHSPAPRGPTRRTQPWASGHWAWDRLLAL